MRNCRNRRNFLVSLIVCCSIAVLYRRRCGNGLGASAFTGRSVASSSPSIRQRNLSRVSVLYYSNNNNSNNRDSQFVHSTGVSSFPATTSSSASLSSALSPVEAWCITHMDVLYSKSLSIKCPFIRRRMADLLDGVDMVMRFLIIRHKSLPLIGPPPGCRSLEGYQMRTKHTNLELTDLLTTIYHDWKTHNHKGYYITGRLNTTIYRDDCLFEGPDPDMPVRGLRKYLNAASQLFDTASSTAELLSLELGFTNGNNDHRSHQLPSQTHATIVARWKLQGVLHLPWHPSLPVWTGKTVYHLDENHLIYLHEEHWDISVLEAFTRTLLPVVANRIWKNEE